MSNRLIIPILLNNYQKHLRYSRRFNENSSVQKGKLFNRIGIIFNYTKVVNSFSKSIFFLAAIVLILLLSANNTFAAINDGYYDDSIIFTDPYWPSDWRVEPFDGLRPTRRPKERPDDLYFNAVLDGDLDKLKDLYWERIDDETLDTNGAFMLRLAASLGYMHIAEYLLSEGVDIDEGVPAEKDPQAEGMNALIYAADDGRTWMVKYLLEQGADIDARDAHGLSAIHFATRHNHLGAIKMLLKYGADINSKTNDGFTTLHISAHLGNSLITEMLIRNGADINAQDNYGNTALHMASKQYRIYDVKILILSGSDVNAKDNEGKTPLDVVGDGYWDKMSKGLNGLRETTIKLIEHYGGERSVSEDF